MALPRKQRRRTLLVLTPLIDVLFLLLIFFMLSSQIAPYSLIPLGGVISGVGEAPAAAVPTGLEPAPVVIRVAHGYVAVGAERIALPELRGAAERFREGDVDRFLLIPTAAADVQDLVSALEALKAASAAEVTLLNPGSVAP